jgi:predicted alpha/beta-hydrolase family hydrolase
VSVAEIETPHGLARAHLRVRDDARGTLVLGHGAAGGVDARDLATVARIAESLGMSVVLVEQPYRVAGRRAPAPARQLDAAWLAVVEHLREEGAVASPLAAGGRSSGARVACRTAEAAGAAGVLCLAFPLQPPRRAGRAPAPSRIAELDGVAVHVLVVQGERDPFGMPPSAPNRTVVTVAGTHGLTSDLAAVGAAAREWLAELLV